MHHIQMFMKKSLMIVSTWQILRITITGRNEAGHVGRTYGIL